MKTHYDVLGIPQQADVNTIKLAYYRNMRRFHPDKLAGELAQQKRMGNTSAVQDIERRIEETQRITKEINTAYAVLSDPARREDYDRSLKISRIEPVQDIRQTHPDYPRRTVKSRPHPNSRGGETFPALLAVAFLLVLLLSLGMLSEFLWHIDGTSRPLITAVGIDADELQSTASARHATREAMREQSMNQPHPTRRTPLESSRAGDAFYEAGNYTYAVELYGRALAEQPENALLYYKRGLASTALYYGGDSDAAEAAIQDFELALSLEPERIEIYRVRGILHYSRWRQTASDAAAQSALSDLERYLARDGEMSEDVTSALSNLRGN